MVVLAALAAPVDPELDRLLGPAAARGLRRALAERARRWADGVAPGRVVEAQSAAAAATALRSHEGPVLLVAPDIPHLASDVARAALDDLSHDVEVVLGAAHDARPYLVGLADPSPELMALVDAPFEQVVAALAERGTALGLLRAERRLSSAADARAMALDPLAPSDLVEHLARLRQ